jgi:putative hydrolase of the HAD superfamily
MLAVFFDAEGVLYYREGKNRRLGAFLEKNRLKLPEADALKSATEEAHERALRGQISQFDFEEAVLAACGVSGPVLQAEGHAILRQEHEAICLFPHVSETLLALKQRGFKLGVITDSAVPKSVKLAWLKSAGLGISWDAYANSMDLGVRKPHERMYQAAMQQAGVTPADSAFVGHAAHELQGARAAGMHAIAFQHDPGAIADTYIDLLKDLLDLPFLRMAG